MSDIDEIERLAKRYAEARTALGDVGQQVEDEMREVQRRYRTQLRRRLIAARTAKEELQQAIADSPKLFTRPKSRILHGIKVGFRKQPGRLVWDSPGAVIKRIREHLPKKASVLIRTKEEPNRQALNNLPVRDLERIGVRSIASSDVPVATAVDSDIDRLIDAWFTDEELDEITDEEAA